MALHVLATSNKFRAGRLQLTGVLQVLKVGAQRSASALFE